MTSSRRAAWGLGCVVGLWAGLAVAQDRPVRLQFVPPESAGTLALPPGAFQLPPPGIDPRIVIPRDPGIDPRIIAARDPNIDPGIFHPRLGPVPVPRPHGWSAPWPGGASAGRPRFRRLR